MIEMICDDSEIKLKEFPDNSIDSCVTDPPYAIGFMSKSWDYKLPSVDFWKEVYRVLKPGAHMLVACGTRTQHRMAVNIEDAGFEIRDVISWIYGSGFPKSLDISKALDKKAGVEREDKFEGSFERRSGPTGNKKCDICGKWLVSGSPCQCPRPQDNPVTDQAKKWGGWGTALKPACEFWTLARKPLSEKTIAENIIKWGTGGINIDDCRIDFTSEADFNSAQWGRGTDIMGGNYVGAKHTSGKTDIPANPTGRFPANVIFDEEAGKILDKQAPATGAFAPVKKGMPGESKGIYGDYADKGDNGASFYADKGGASRFFYCPKASTDERNRGLEDFEKKLQANANFRPNHLEDALEGDSGKPHGRYTPTQNNHPTVKPVALMEYLIRLITPPKGIVLDPFNGSGSTGCAASVACFSYIGIEKEKDYVEISKARVKAWPPELKTQYDLFEGL